MCVYVCVRVCTSVCDFVCVLACAHVREYASISFIIVNVSRGRNVQEAARRTLRSKATGAESQYSTRNSTDMHGSAEEVGGDGSMIDGVDVGGAGGSLDSVEGDRPSGSSGRGNGAAQQAHVLKKF